MADQTAADHVRAMRTALQMIDLQVSDTPIPLDQLSELKSEIDSLRLRIWASMSSKAEGSAALELFRVRRAIEGLHRISGDIEQGALSVEHQEIEALSREARRFEEARRAAAS